MMQRDVVTVEAFFNQCQAELGLRLLAGANGLTRIIREPTVNRPGLALAGYTKYFAQNRLQVIGSAEMHFFKSLKLAERTQRYANLFSYRIPALVLCRNYRADKPMIRASEEAGVPLFVSPMVTMKFINQATLHLETMLAPRDNELGSMVDILGIGVIIRGQSGIGKSECVLALIERGYSLVSDDITRVILNEGREIIGTSPESTRNHMEVRGIGIINVPAMFGIKSIRTNKRVDLVITLKTWGEVPDIDRVGIDEGKTKVLGIDLPHITIPVLPGRDIARLVEVAAFHTKLRMAGFNPAKEFNDSLIARMAPKPKP